VLRPRTVRAIAAARAAGIRVLIVTGRMFQSARPYAQEAGIRDPLICYQGAVVADPVTGEFLRHEPIPLALAREAIAAVQNAGFALNVYVDDELYVAQLTQNAERYAGFQHIVIHTVGDLLAWLEKPPTKLVSVDGPHALDRLEVEMKALFDGRLYIAKSLPHFLEFASPGVTKAAGLDFLSEHLGFTPDETVAFGDGENDVELLEWAGYAVAVANAHQRVLDRADFVCPSVHEEGVAQVIEALVQLRA
jgi:Cof subfamily protein (haloacid dehalogenase superfamily)